MILDKVNYPKDVQQLSVEELGLLASEIRDLIISVVAKNGGHLAPSLGTVELTLALLSIFSPPEDKIVWDVGHQSYTYKILTGRKERFSTIRQQGGLSGFNNIFESEYDAFTVGHASTSISAALGLAKARDIHKKENKVVAIIGDGSLTGGLAMEGLNNAGASHTDLTVILNDNGMSIAPNVGAMSHHLTKVITNPVYNTLKTDFDRIVGAGFIGKNLKNAVFSLKGLLTPGRLFEDFGFRYFGPVEGHDINELKETFSNIKNLKGPKLVHIKTIKGKGYKHAEQNAHVFHGIGAFDHDTGAVHPAETEKMSFSKVAGAIGELIADNFNETAFIVAAMPAGTGTDNIQAKYPERYFDTGIAEGHAVTFAAGLAREKIVSYVFLYSSFLQRAYDNIIHDVALQKLPVVFCVDRAGIVGEDGPTHHGVFDIPFLGSVPGLTLWSPVTLVDLAVMMKAANQQSLVTGPIAIRYPRHSMDKIDIASVYEAGDELLSSNSVEPKNAKNVIFAVGSTYQDALAESRDIESVQVVPVTKLYPFDESFFDKFLKCAQKCVIIEEGVKTGSFGSYFLLRYTERGCKITLKTFSLPDEFITHGKRNALLEMYSLKGAALKKELEEFFKC